MQTRLFFGASTGRTGTMHLANVLNAEDGCTCVHEGKFRHRESAGEQLLPFLTLENRLAYEQPARAAAIIAEKRAVLDDMDFAGATHFGDIAYNYCPFILPLAERFPQAKILAIVRDGRSFVRSATVTTGEDDAPVGWPPDDKPLSKLERYIALGRLQPRRDSADAQAWPAWGALEKNVWLWAETNKILLDALEKLDQRRYFILRFEEFVSEPLESYTKIRNFLGLQNAMSDAVKQVLLSPVVNARRTYSVPGYEQWSPDSKAHFARYAGDVMRRLGYVYE